MQNSFQTAPKLKTVASETWESKGMVLLSKGQDLTQKVKNLILFIRGNDMSQWICKSLP